MCFYSVVNIVHGTDAPPRSPIKLPMFLIVSRTENVFIEVFIVCEIIVRSAAAGAEHPDGAVGAFAIKH